MVINIGSLHCLRYVRATSQGAWSHSLHLNRLGSGRTLLIYTFLPLARLSGLKENREFLWGQKDLEKPALDLSCLCWQKIRLILKQIYCFGFSPRLTGMGPDHDFRTQPGRQWATWVILRNTLASWDLPGTWARLPWAFSDLAGE